MRYRWNVWRKPAPYVARNHTLAGSASYCAATTTLPRRFAAGQTSNGFVSREPNRDALKASECWRVRNASKHSRKRNLKLEIRNPKPRTMHFVQGRDRQTPNHEALFRIQSLVLQKTISGRSITVIMLGWGSGDSGSIPGAPTSKTTYSMFQHRWHHPSRSPSTTHPDHHREGVLLNIAGKKETCTIEAEAKHIDKG